jgi:hypothetical protein
MQGVFSLTAGQTLSILVGTQPCATTTLYPGGGGGTFVALGTSYTTATPLIVAGGGGGGYSGTAPAACGGQATQLGSGNSLYQPSAGYGSLSAPCGGGGGGFYSSGGTDTFYNFPGAQGFRQGGAGAVPNPSYSGYTNGGFGGGGTANFVGSCNTRGGAGGGYSGGTGNNGNSAYFGNGGGSFNGGLSQVNRASYNNGSGLVEIVASTPLVALCVFLYMYKPFFFCEKASLLYVYFCYFRRPLLLFRALQPPVHLIIFITSACKAFYSHKYICFNATIFVSLYILTLTFLFPAFILILFYFIIIVSS